MGRPTIDIEGKRFDRLLVLERAVSKQSSAMWKCLCDCDKETVVASYDLRAGKTKSCGCKRGPHRGYRDRLYPIWLSMLHRCEVIKHKDYRLYGARGIQVCKKWHDYNVFRDWASSSGYNSTASFGACTIDRVNNDGNYEPSNCRWATMQEQANNKRVKRGFKQ